MKKLFTLSLSLAMMVGQWANAQSNLNFESWTGNEPNGWSSLNSITQSNGGAQTTFKESSNPGEGSFSVKMVTGNCPDCPSFSVLGPFGLPTPLPNPLGGAVELGTFDNPGIPYTQRPISVDFRYKSNPGANDACGLHVELTRYNAQTDEDETIGEGYFEANTQVNTWTSVNIPIAYYSDLTPDKLSIWATSSIGSVPDLTSLGLPALPLPTPVAGSTFYVDAIVLNLPSCDGFTISLNGTNESSIGAADGSVSVTPQGGTPPYSYSWSNLENSSSINGLIPGYYIVTVTDANQCQKVGTYYVAPGGCNLSVSMSGTNSTSNSIFSGNGTASASVTGGNAPYTYEWNTGATTSSISNLAVGTYAVLVTEQNNPFCATWSYFTVYGPDGPTNSIAEGSTELTSALAVYPNPTRGQLTFQTESDIRHIQIMNAVGETIWNSNYNNSMARIDLSSQPSGIYFYRVHNEKGEMITGNVVVE